MKTINYKDLTQEVSDKHKIAMWGGEDDEALHHTEINEAIEDILDASHPDPFPETLTLCGYKRREIEASDIGIDQVLKDILEKLDYAYGNPSLEPTEPTITMTDMGDIFSKAIQREYEVWSCEGVILVELTDVKGWVRENCQHWMEDEVDPRRF